MWIAVLSGLIVSVDALFIGVSFGTQKNCKLWHILLINILLTFLCFIGHIIGLTIASNIDFDFDTIVAVSFITLGLLVIVSYFQPRQNSNQNIVITGTFMSIEAMVITIGLTLMLDTTTVLIPISVAFFHFFYCVLTFFLSKYLRKLPQIVGHMISGIALLIYGTMALVI